MNWRRFGLLGLPLLLGSCLKDQERQLGQCIVDSLHTYPTETTSRTVYDRGHLVRQCMAAAGYEFSFRDDLCQPDYNDSQEMNSHCYRPMGAIDRFFRKAEILFSAGL